MIKSTQQKFYLNESKNFRRIILLVLLSVNCIGQTASPPKTTTSPNVYKQKNGIDQPKHIDSENGYSVIVQKWWTIKDTSNPDFFGGTFPELNTSKSALLFKSFEKEKFKTLSNFEKWVLLGYKSGDTPKWSENHKILFKKNSDHFQLLGRHS